MTHIAKIYREIQGLKLKATEAKTPSFIGITLYQQSKQSLMGNQVASKFILTATIVRYSDIIGPFSYTTSCNSTILAEADL